jgi:hypothetical protein
MRSSRQSAGSFREESIVYIGLGTLIIIIIIILLLT